MSILRLGAVCLLVLSVSFLVRADEVAKENVRKSLKALADATLGEQRAEPGAELKRSAQELLESEMVQTGNLESREFLQAVDDLSIKAARIGGNGPLVKAVKNLKSASASLKIADASPSPSATPTPSGSPSGSPKEQGDERWLVEIILFDFIPPLLRPAFALLTLILLGYIAFAITTQRQFIMDSVGAVMVRGFQNVRTQHESLAKQQTAFGETQATANDRIADIHNELKRVSRALVLLQQNGAGRDYGLVQSSTEGTKERLPTFPIAADDFLQQMRSKMLVLKRDFQNDMLIADQDARGELVLIRDPNMPDESQPLLLVPRVTQLQMSQDYHNFYARYFECSNPESGSVWILAPATADKVIGGWRLREKGRLEIR